MLASMRRVLTISLMVNNIDGFTEAGFTFHAGNRAGKRPVDDGAVMTSRPLANTKRTLIICYSVDSNEMAAIFPTSVRKCNAPVG